VVVTVIVIVAVAPAFPVTTYEHVPAATGENVNVPLPDSGDAVAMPAHVVVLSVNAPV
jgi:hypothetical protein